MNEPYRMSTRDQKVQGIFERITAHYDTINTAMTLGRHAQWCREVVRRARLPETGSLLDIATGTGEIALAARRRHPRARITGVDFSTAMLEAAADKPGGERVDWRFADAHALDFADESFNAVTHGYLLRNVSDVPRVLAEQFRVLVPGGRLVILETAPPRGVLKLAVAAGMSVVLPLLGRIMAKDPDAYTYLKDSTLEFASPERVAQLVREAGFTDVGFDRKYLGTNVITWARKPGPADDPRGGQG